MILKNFTPLTPVRRFFFYYLPFIHKKLKKKYLYNKIVKNNANKSKKNRLISTHIKTKKRYPIIIQKHQTLKTLSGILSSFFLAPNRKKLFCEFINVYTKTYSTVALNTHFVGFQFLTNHIQINQPIYLSYVPYYYTIALIT